MIKAQKEESDEDTSESGSSSSSDLDDSDAVLVDEGATKHWKDSAHETPTRSMLDLCNTGPNAYQSIASIFARVSEGETGETIQGDALGGKEEGSAGLTRYMAAPSAPCHTLAMRHLYKEARVSPPELPRTGSPIM